MTITKILDELSRKISQIISAQNNGIDVRIELANIATLNDGDEFVEKSSIILSIVNIEDDKALRNQGLYKEHNGTTVERYKKPAQNLVLSLLFASYNKDQSQNKYTDGIDKLEYIIKCLQNNNVYYYDNLQLREQTEISEAEANSLNKLILDMVSLKTEPLNQMWSYLGSKYMPSVLYTMRLIPIQNENNLPQHQIVRKAKIQLWNEDANDPTGLLESGEFTKNN